MNYEKLKILVDELIEAKRVRAQLLGSQYLPKSLELIIARLERQIKREVTK